MRRTLIGALIAVVFPAMAEAQDAKPAPLADYVFFCLAVWEAAHDLQSKATALGLQGVTGSADASLTIGKTTVRFYKSSQTNQTVAATSTTFKDGKDWSCDVNLPMVTQRAELETMEQAADLDGQIATLGPAIIGRWKMRRGRSPVLIRAIAGKPLTLLTVQKFEPAQASANAKLPR